MISVPKSQFISATAQLVPNLMRPIVPCIVQKTKINIEKERQALNGYSLAKSMITGPMSVTSGIGMKSQVRFVHTDVKVPDYAFYRKESSKDATKSSEGRDSATKAFTYVILGGAAVSAVYGAQKVVHSAVGSLSMTADMLAMGKTEINLADIPEGKSITFKWRGKPLFVRHRTAKEIETETNVDLSHLRDPQHDADRAQRPEWLIIIGICTHLGCIPIANAGNFGGYFCPCHGSHYDASGRIRKGPAPLNLEVPLYKFTEDNRLIVG